MKQLSLCVVLFFYINNTTAQSTPVELFDLIKKFITDSTGYSQVGDWNVGSPKNFPVKWKSDRIEMSDDTSINFYMLGTAHISIQGKTFLQNQQPLKWNVMLKGPRMGYTSFSIVSGPSKDLQPKWTIDSLFGKQVFRQKLVKRCDQNPLTGFYFYEFKLRKKDMVYLKLSWITVNGMTALRIDCYDSYTLYAAKLDCK
ncbi:MAG: hypothetical protein HEQ40_04080 [Lacibacter sp.]|jgi:hypothetical protein